MLYTRSGRLITANSSAPDDLNRDRHLSSGGSTAQVNIVSVHPGSLLQIEVSTDGGEHEIHGALSALAFVNATWAFDDQTLMCIPR